jgi:hypothetical protein
MSHPGPASQLDKPAAGCAFSPVVHMRNGVWPGIPPLVEIEDGHLSACRFAGNTDFVSQFENRVARDRTDSKAGG